MKVTMMRKIISFLVALTILASATPACSWLKSEEASGKADVIACAKATAPKGTDLITASLEVAATIAAAVASGGGLAAVEAVVVDLIKTYGEPIVACVVKDKVGGAASAGSASHAAPTPEQLVLLGVLQHHGWRFE